MAVVDAGEGAEDVRGVAGEEPLQRVGPGQHDPLGNLSIAREPDYARDVERPVTLFIVQAEQLRAEQADDVVRQDVGVVGGEDYGHKLRKAEAGRHRRLDHIRFSIGEVPHAERGRGHRVQVRVVLESRQQRGAGLDRARGALVERH
jgi:hypothetical protein